MKEVLVVGAGTWSRFTGVDFGRLASVGITVIVMEDETHLLPSILARDIAIRRGKSALMRDFIDRRLEDFRTDLLQLARDIAHSPAGAFVQNERIRAFARRAMDVTGCAQLIGGVSAIAALPRSRIRSWRSLNEKRMAWGFR